MNNEKIFNQPCRIGFSNFPEKEGGTTYLESDYKLLCRGYRVKVKVKVVDVTFGGYSCRAVTTSRVNIAEYLPYGGFASYCHMDEAETMKQAAQLFCYQHDIQLCNLINNWPFFKAIVANINGK